MCIRDRLFAVLNLVQMIVNNLLPVLGADAGLADELLKEFLAHGGVCVCLLYTSQLAGRACIVAN